MASGGLIKVQPLVSVLTTSTAGGLSTGLFVGGSTGPLAATFSGEAFAISTASSTGRLAYAGMQLVSCNAVSWSMVIESATACAFASPTTRFTFASQSCSGAQFLAPIAQPECGTTDIQFWRAKCTPTATTDLRLGVIWVGFQ